MFTIDLQLCYTIAYQTDIEKSILKLCHYFEWHERVHNVKEPCLLYIAPAAPIETSFCANGFLTTVHATQLSSDGLRSAEITFFVQVYTEYGLEFT